jgi:hypothetical protein
MILSLNSMVTVKQQVLGWSGGLWNTEGYAAKAGMEGEVLM